VECPFGQTFCAAFIGHGFVANRLLQEQKAIDMPPSSRFRRLDLMRWNISGFVSYWSSREIEIKRQKFHAWCPTVKKLTRKFCHPLRCERYWGVFGEQDDEFERFWLNLQTLL
jgi:hypothetical protein